MEGVVVKLEAKGYLSRKALGPQTSTSPRNVLLQQPGTDCRKTDVLAVGDFYSLLLTQEGLITELQGRSATIS